MINGYDKEQLAILNKKIPDSLISRREKGREVFSYVEASYIIELLNQIYGYMWHWEVGDTQIRKTGGQDKYGNDKSFITVKGRLTVPMLNPNWYEGSTNESKYVWIAKESFGSHPFTGTDPEVQGFAFKSAATDALKKCASLFGVAKSVYMSDSMLLALEEEANQDIWTEETKALYQQEYNDMVAFAKEHSDLNYYKKVFCDETQNFTEYMQITPSNIRAFLAWVKEYDARFEEPKAADPKPAASNQPW